MEWKTKTSKIKDNSRIKMVTMIERMDLIEIEMHLKMKAIIMSRT